MAESSVVVYSLVYILVAFCFIAPPKEFVSAGLTIQNIFSGFLGSVHLDFIEYHLRRTTLTVFIHSLIPLGYFMLLPLVSGDIPEISVATAKDILFVAPYAVSLLIALCGTAAAFIWSTKQWRFHPLSKSLARYSTSRRAVASRIGTEFRSIDKFSSVIGGTSVYVTDSWIIKCSAYSVSIVQQSDAHLSVLESEQHDISHESEQPSQFVKIMVYDIDPHKRPFDIRLNALEYSDLKDKLQAPLRNARNVVIHQSLSDLFLAEFIKHVTANEKYPLGDQPVESCIGCMQKPADVKLQKCCTSDGEKPCISCYCRPMWCVECMGKWFASRQNQRQPETWLGGKSPCPTCRATFCMLDILMVQT